MRPASHLYPERDDLQGALEFAYDLLAPPHVDGYDTPAVTGSVILGPLLWLAKTYGRPDVLGWLNSPPHASHANALCRSLIDPDNHRHNEQLHNAIQRIQPCFEQPRPALVHDLNTRFNNILTAPETTTA